MRFSFGDKIPDLDLGMAQYNDGEMRELWLRHVSDMPDTIDRHARREPFSASFKKEETMSLGGIKNCMEHFLRKDISKDDWDCLKWMVREFFCVLDLISVDVGGIARFDTERAAMYEREIESLKKTIDYMGEVNAALRDEIDVKDSALADKWDRIGPESNIGDTPENIAGCFSYKPGKNMPAIYFLVSDGEVVYVGKSLFFPNRIRSHESDPNKVFDSVYILPCAESRLCDWENALISLYDPIYNKTSGYCLKSDHGKSILAEISAVGGSLPNSLFA